MCKKNGRFFLYPVSVSLFSEIFYNEIKILLKLKKLNIFRVGYSLREIANTIASYEGIKSFVKEHGKIDLAYCYWNNTQAYSACIAKRLGLIGIVVSRLHNYDVYEQRTRYNYMPLKRQFANTFDVLCALSEEGKKYIAQNYGMSPDTIQTRPLGVSLPDYVGSPSEFGMLHLISVSYCTPVKRIDRIIRGLELALPRLPDRHVKWTHVGGGDLQKQLEQLAFRCFQNLRNIEVDFKGDLTTAEVRKWYSSTKIDLFINTSEYEGMPVSIMEAMSYGIPVIAPDVGGISDIVNSENGYLLPGNLSSHDVEKAIILMANALENNKNTYRNIARKTVEDKFDSAKNYKNFVNLLQTMVFK
jgi:colanic acid/amylovoran biosynthesis glycosyltransferase